MTANRLTPAQMKGGGGDDPGASGRGWGLGLGVQVAASPYGVAARGTAHGWDGGFGTSWFNDPARA